jgi:site-specific recombinase XerD
VHTLRHTFGSQLIAAGADVKSVQELLGHASALVTLDVYAHAFGDRKRAAVEALPPLGTVDHPAQVRPALRAAGQ